MAKTGIENSTSDSDKNWYDWFEMQWGGYFKSQVLMTWVERDTFFQPEGEDKWFDNHTELRLKNKTFFGEWCYFEIHYENIFSLGDTQREKRAFEKLYSDFFLISSSALSSRMTRD